MTVRTHVATMTFGDLTIEYDARVLTPRPWTILQAQWAAEIALTAPPGPVLELCAGAGQIGLATAHATTREVVCVDNSPEAVSICVRNVERAGLTGRVHVRHADLGTALRVGEQFALAIADPPWVPRSDVGRFPEDPVPAIDGGPDGLDGARSCLRACTGHLAAGGSLLLQLGDDDQADRFVSEARPLGWRSSGRRHGERGLILRLLHP